MHLPVKRPIGGCGHAKENVITTTSILAKLGAMAAAFAAPVTLFLGAGTAQAGVSANANSAPGGVDVEIRSWGNPAPGGWCTYPSVVQGNPIGKPLPAINVPFYLRANDRARLWFPSYPTGSTWDIRVNCPDTGTQITTVVW